MRITAAPGVGRHACARMAVILAVLTQVLVSYRRMNMAFSRERNVIYMRTGDDQDLP